MVRLLLIVQVPNASDQRRVALTFRPVNRFSLSFECSKHVVLMILDDIVFDVGPLGSALRARAGAVTAPLGRLDEGPPPSPSNADPAILS